VSVATAAARHVAIVRPWAADAIERGDKTIESRFSRSRREPFGRVRPDDVVYFRVVGGGYRLRARVARVRSFADLLPEDVARLEARYRGAIGGDEAYWERAAAARFATLLWLADVGPRSRGPELPRRKGDRRAWFSLG